MTSQDEEDVSKKKHAETSQALVVMEAVNGEVQRACDRRFVRTFISSLYYQH